MSGNIDDLIQELYGSNSSKGNEPRPKPASNATGGAATTSSPAPTSTSKGNTVTNSFDDDDDGKPRSTGSQPQPKPGKQSTPASRNFDDEEENIGGAKKSVQTKPSGGSSGNGRVRSGFDEDSDEEDAGPQKCSPAGSSNAGASPWAVGGGKPSVGGVSPGLAKPPVQFPQLPATPLVKSCFHKCTLSSEVQRPRPCPYIRCIQCDYLVVRCPQPARWCDESGQKDIYLEMRYHYPDWSAFSAGVLEYPPRSSSAAFCCQCTWFTVIDDAEFVIETPIGATKFNKHTGGHHTQPPPFCTSSLLAKAGGNTKPLPRWICCGHPS
jgi:hypothetical protein